MTAALRRALALLVSGALLSCAPGAEAFAQAVVAAAPAAPLAGAGLPAGVAAVPGVGAAPASLSLPAPGLLGTVSLPLLPAPRLGPAQGSPSSALPFVSAEPASRALALSALIAPRSEALPAPSPRVRTAAAPVRVSDSPTPERDGRRAPPIERSLRSSAREAGEAARPTAGAEASAARLHELYSGPGRFPQGADDAPAVASGRQGRPLSALARAAASQGRDASRPLEPPKPRRSLLRAVGYGYAAGVLGLAVALGSIAAAQALGYTLQPNYTSPGSGTGTRTVAGALSLLFSAAVAAPILEELLFRALLMGGLIYLGSKVLPKPWAAAASGLLTSVVFVLLHETADPLLIGLRLADALLMAWTYHREGVAASMAMHATHNGLLAAVSVAGTLLPAGQLWAWGLGALALAAAALIAAGVGLLRQRADRRAGRIAPHELTEEVCVALAGILLFGTAAFSLHMFPLTIPAAFALYYYGTQELGPSRAF